MKRGGNVGGASGGGRVLSLILPHVLLCACTSTCPTLYRGVDMIYLTKLETEISRFSLGSCGRFPLFAQNMVRVERRVMKKLFWSHDPVMSSVYASETWVQHLRNTVGTALERAIAPAAEYLETLEPFVEFLNVDGEPHAFALRNVNICRSHARLTQENSRIRVFFSLGVRHIAGVVWSMGIRKRAQKR